MPIHCHGHRERAKNELSRGANPQLLGADEGDDPEFMTTGTKEVEAACRNAWALYQSSRAKKSSGMKVLLLESIADAQYVGLESATVSTMTTEMNRLVSSGEIKKVARGRLPRWVTDAGRSRTFY